MGRLQAYLASMPFVIPYPPLFLIIQLLLGLGLFVGTLKIGFKCILLVCA